MSTYPASESPVPAPSPPQQVHPRPCVKRDDVVLLTLLPEKSLNYEESQPDLSFFPQETFTGVDWQFPYRPAVLRKFVMWKTDVTYFGLDVYPLTRRTNGLQGLLSRRSRSFKSLEALAKAGPGIQVPCDNIFVYRPRLLELFHIEFDQVSLSSSVSFLMTDQL
jgi:hypothetical protein